MTANTTTLSTHADENWPSFAPSWARHASIEPDGDVIFERVWSILSQYRDAPDFDLVKVEQVWTAGEGGDFRADPVRIVVGDGEIWADSRVGEVARTLRDIANALDPVPLGGAA